MDHKSQRKWYIFGSAIVLCAVFLAVFEACKPRVKRGKLASTEEGNFKALTGGVCSTSGQFTQQALANAKVVKDRIDSFMNNPDCTAVVRAVAEIPTGLAIAGAPTEESGGADTTGGMSLFAMSEEIQALRRVSSGGAAYANMGVKPEQVSSLMNQRLFQMIGVEQSPITEGADQNSVGIQRVQNDIKLALNQKTRILRAAGTAIDTVGNMFDGLAASTSCPINQPGMLGPIVMASVKILGSYAGADPGLAAKAAGALQKFMNYARTEYFRNALATLDQAELGLTISCLIETTANGYCSVRDNIALQKDVLETDKSTIANMRGYVIFSRELPILTKWLILLKSSQPTRVPGIIADQIANMTTPMIVQQKRFEIASNIENVRYNLDADVRTARTSVYQLAEGISGVLSGPVANGVPAFFDMRYNPKFRVFALLGLSVPEDVTRSVQPLDPEQYFANANYEQVGDALTALNTIQAKVSEMFATVSGQVATYLARNSNQDAPGVIAGFEQGPSVNSPSPRKVLVNIQNYMLDILKGINEDAKNDPSIALSARPLKVVLIDTIKKIDKILEASDAVRKGSEKLDAEADELLNRSRRTNLALDQAETAKPFTVSPSEADKKLASLTTPIDGKGSSIADASIAYDQEIKENKDAIKMNSSLEGVFAKFRQFGAVVVTELDMDTQLDMMITNRMARVLQYDMQQMMRKSNGGSSSAQMSSVTKALLMVSNDLMADRFLSVFNGDPQKMKLDLASAQTINIATLEAIGAAPEGFVNPLGTTNPIVNTFMRSIGVLAARTVGGAQSPKDISSYIAEKADPRGVHHTFVKALNQSITDTFVAELSRAAMNANLNPVGSFMVLFRQQKAIGKFVGSDAILAGVSSVSSTQSYGRWLRPDLYWVPNYWSGNRLFSDTPDGAMATLRSTFCMQTISLPDPRPFNAFCKGAILYSVFENQNVVDKRRGGSVTLNVASGSVELSGLSLIYDDWYSAYERNEQTRKSAGSNYVNQLQSQRICALHDHLRANEIFSLTRPMRDAEFLGKSN
ncbi:MAG: hypothetical protein NTV34_18095 [Proteobacteria bacterium]|nr:hypothetical protein [Pseudomonadota bacterium]